MKHIAFVVLAVVVAYTLSVIVAEPGSNAQYIIAGAFGFGLLYIYGMLAVSFWARRWTKDNPGEELPGLGRRAPHTDPKLKKEKTTS